MLGEDESGLVVVEFSFCNLSRAMVAEYKNRTGQNEEEED